MARKTSRQGTKTKLSKDGKERKSVWPQDAETKPKPTFWRRLLKALPLILLAVLFTFVLNRAGLFAELENAFLDTQMRIAATATESDVLIVDITQEDFDDKNTFRGETRPVNVNALQRLIEAVAEGGPCVIGVDIDTSFDKFKDFQGAEKLQNVIWVRPAEISGDPDHKHIPLDVLGGQNPEIQNERSGLAITKPDAKGVTRYYSRLVDTTQGEMPSFAWAIFTKGKDLKCPGIKFPDLDATTEPRIINFSRAADGSGGGGRTKIDAGVVLNYASDHWRNNNIIRDKIVIIGGSYLGEDKRDTPLVRMNGYDIIANVIETDLSGRDGRLPGLLSKIVLQIFDGILLITLFQIFAWRKAVLSLPFIIILSLACSFFTYYSFSQWAFFAPVMVGVLLTELFDRGKDYFKKQYKHEIAETYRDLREHEPEFADRKVDE